MMQALEQILFAILLTVLLASQAEGKLNKEHEKLSIEESNQNDKTTVSDDQNLQDRITAPEDREVILHTGERPDLRIRCAQTLSKFASSKVPLNL